MPTPLLLRTHQACTGAAGRWEVCGLADPAGPAPAATCKRTAQPEAAAPEVAPQDWDLMLGAVAERLSRAVHLPSTAPAATLAQTRLPDTVLDCVNALEQLRSMLRGELGRQQQLALEAFDARTALSQARAELAGTKAGEKIARHQALHDSLTALPNREHFIERLDLALTPVGPARRPLAVLFLDLDGFKPINDAHGHDIGDQVLRIIAARLSRSVRAEDMVGRLGGDEFACLLSNLPSREQLCHLACKLFDAVASPIQLGGLELTVRPSIGIATCPADGVTDAELLRNADAAMYRAKRSGSGYAFHGA